MSARKRQVELEERQRRLKAKLDSVNQKIDTLRKARERQEQDDDLLSWMIDRWNMDDGTAEAVLECLNLCKFKKFTDMKLLVQWVEEVVGEPVYYGELPTGDVSIVKAVKLSGDGALDRFILTKKSAEVEYDGAIVSINPDDGVVSVSFFYSKDPQ